MQRDGPAVARSYLRRAKIQDFGPLVQLDWALPPDAPDAGWHVVIGDNGTGKTSFLKAISLALIGDDATLSLRVDPRAYVRVGSKGASVSVTMADGSARGFRSARPQRGPAPPAEGYHAAFGASRRFLGDRASKRLEASDPVSARHASLFDPDWSLGDLVGWLKDLQLDGKEEILGTVRSFVNQEGLLPGARLERITSLGPRFVDAAGHEVGLDGLSDGYQSALALALEIVRQSYLLKPQAKTITRRAGAFVVDVPGVVLIDEVDAHLHPTWQARIGTFFTSHFPRMQFIVTTHSPLVCRAAERGTIFRLPSVGSAEVGRFLIGQERERLLYGDILDAYGTEVFGRGVTRGRAGQEKFDRLAELNVKAGFSKLDADESDERDQLQRLL